MTAKWYVKDLSKLTKVSVQTLHHYDRIDLLKPSLRLDNGYRVYTEKDLLKLQQIIALKFFGFELAQIKELLTADVNIMDHFKAQSKLLQQKANMLSNASHSLTEIVSTYRDQKSIPWQAIIETIEVFNMTNELENNWLGKVLNKQEVAQYVKFVNGLEERFTPADKAKSENAWFDLVKEINANCHRDPADKKSREIAASVMAWVNHLYGKENIPLRSVIWEKGFKGNDAGDKHGLSPTAVTWLDAAMKADYRHKVLAIVNQVGAKTDVEVMQAFADFLQETCGDFTDLKVKILQAALVDEDVTAAARKVLQKMKLS